MSCLTVFLVLRLCGAMRSRSSRRRHYLTCADLHSPSLPSAWDTLRQSGSVKGFIDTFGVSPRSFQYLCDRMKSFVCPPRQARYTVADVLAIALHFLNSRIEQRNLCFIYARAPSTLNDYLQIGLEGLANVMQNEPLARIQWPSRSRMKKYSQIITRRHPTLQNVFGFVDGVFFKVANSSDPFVQNAYYNGWKSCCAVSNVIVFGPDGTILHARINAPGSWHDSAIAEKLYDLLENKTPSPFKIVGDSAFVHNDKLMAVGKSRSFIANEEALTSLRQAAEWGMLGVQTKFPRLNCMDKLAFNPAYYRNVLALCFQLYNYKTRTENLNQIKTVYCGRAA